MTDFKVNKRIWDVLSEPDKLRIVAHLQQHGALKPNQNIIADAHTPPPSIASRIFDSTTGGAENIKALGVDWMCRAICDSTKAETNCSLYGQSLSACLATISASREADQTDMAVAESA
ncbi:MAG TPA: hypothetical protein VMV48_08605 [Gallionellaceae bacterium]|nr:hypothetical protein [Gallionellaceae bacterium]